MSGSIEKFQAVLKSGPPRELILKQGLSEALKQFAS